MHGEGHLIYGDGRTYKGQYQNDTKHGQGIYTWSDGRVYDGGWRHGHQHGEGKFTTKDGFTRFGLWENGKRIKWYNHDGATIQSSDIAASAMPIDNT